MNLGDVFAVRAEQADDQAAIRRVHELAFPSPAEAELVEALHEEGAAVPDLCLVALQADELVGHIAFSRAELDSGVPVLALAPMAVLPEWQGRGAGSALVREGLRRAAATDFPLIVVVGHETYYPRFGFERGDAHGVLAPFDVPAGAWMVYLLPAYRSEARGHVAYADAFSKVV